MYLFQYYQIQDWLNGLGVTDGQTQVRVISVHQKVKNAMDLHKNTLVAFGTP